MRIRYRFYPNQMSEKNIDEAGSLSKKSRNISEKSTLFRSKKDGLIHSRWRSGALH